MESKLPLFKTFFAISSIAFSLVLVLIVPSRSYAATAFIEPSQGTINARTFQVVLHVESSISEPEIASTNIKISYPASVTATEITEGDFDSYLEKTIDSTARVVTIKAVNNAQNYKSGDVELGLVKFTTNQDTGQVQLVISEQSEITGAGGEQLFTESINSNFTLKYEDPTGTTATDPTTTTTTTTTDTTGTAPETGINETLQYVLISAAMLIGGLYLSRGTLKIRK